MSEKLKVAKLQWQVKGRRIVDGVDVTVSPGEFVGIIGPNGSGKSSFLRCVYRVNRPHFGRVFLDGEDLWKMSARQAACRCAAVPQEMPSQFDFTVREIVSMGRYPYKKVTERETCRDRRLVAQALDYVGLSQKADQLFSSLSGGEKQRTLIARAIAQDADFLVLDEPTNHLDIYYQLEIMDLIRRMGIASLVVMHDLNLASQYCDRLYVLCRGRVVAAGQPQDVVTSELLAQVYHVKTRIVPRLESGRPQISFLCRLDGEEPSR
ncbi:MAG: ABC transporter ATP-binding protein [Pyramidobacter sp.]|jgi:iron complex transport system ATP-binding protein